MTTPAIPSLSNKTPIDIRRAIDAIKRYLITSQGSLDTVATLARQAYAAANTNTSWYVTPPAPTGLLVNGAFNSIILQWDTNPATGHAYTEVWRSTTDDLGAAVCVGFSSGRTFADIPPDSSLSVTYYYWIRYVNLAGTPGPYNAVAGTPGSTADDPAYLLEVLSGEITASQLYADLASQIAKIDITSTIQEALDILDGTIVQEAQDRADAITLEVSDRNAAVLIETNARIDDIASEVSDRDAAVLVETNARVGADSVLASARETLSAIITGLADPTGKVLADLSAGLIYEEKTVRASDISAEVSSRNTLAAQLRGSYTGSDLGSLTSGLVYQESSARVTQDEAIATSMALLSAGVGEQFDYSVIWHFDDTVESWTGNGTPTVSGGWLKPAAQASNPYVISPASLAINSTTYRQIKARIKKHGTPTWDGTFYWQTTTDSTWDAARSETISEPSFDTNDIVTITWDVEWTGTIDQLRIDLSTASDGTDYYEIDWAAVGRPSPGASLAALVTEGTTRASADSAEGTSREILSTIVTGATDPTGLTLATITSGLVYDEKTARSSADGSEVTARQQLSTKITGANDPSSLTLGTLASGLIYDEKTVRISADSGQVSRISTLETTVNNATTGVTATASALDVVELIVNDGDSGNSALATDISALEATVNNVTTGVTATASALDVVELLVNDGDSGNSALATAITTLETTVDHPTTGVAATASALDVVELLVNDGDSGNSALATAVSALEATVDNPTTGVTATASALDTVELIVNDGDSGNSALATDIEGLETTITNPTTGLPAAHAAVVSEASTRSTNDGALASDITALGVEVLGADGTATTAGVVHSAISTATTDMATSTEVSGLEASIINPGGEIDQAIIAEYETVAAGLTTFSAATKQVSVSDGGSSATVETHMTAYRTDIGALEGKYTVKVDANGYVAGFGLAVYANDGTMVSDFLIAVDRFAIVSPGATSAAFVVDSGKVVMDAAFIKDATITNAKIANVAADKLYVASGTLAEALIGTGHIDNAMIGNFIQSTAFSPGVGGWRIDKDGDAEFHNIVIYDSSGNIALASGSGVNWSSVAGTGKPANNATVGATWKSNITSQPSDTVLLNANTTPADIGYTGALDATKGATWKSNVSNQPSDASIITSQGTAAAIASQGDFATLDQVTADNINTYIAGAAIDTAYIKNAAIKTALIDDANITTLKVKEQNIVKTAGAIIAEVNVSDTYDVWTTRNTITSSIIAGIDVSLNCYFRVRAETGYESNIYQRFKITVGGTIYYTESHSWYNQADCMSEWYWKVLQISSSTSSRTVTINHQTYSSYSCGTACNVGGPYPSTVNSVMMCWIYQR